MNNRTVGDADPYKGWIFHPQIMSRSAYDFARSFSPILFFKTLLTSALRFDRIGLQENNDGMSRKGNERFLK
jgi:hypothetical protein